MDSLNKVNFEKPVTVKFEWRDESDDEPIPKQPPRKMQVSTIQQKSRMSSILEKDPLNPKRTSIANQSQLAKKINELDPGSKISFNIKSDLMKSKNGKSDLIPNGEKPSSFMLSKLSGISGSFGPGKKF